MFGGVAFIDTNIAGRDVKIPTEIPADADSANGNAALVRLDALDPFPLLPWLLVSWFSACHCVACVSLSDKAKHRFKRSILQIKKATEASFLSVVTCSQCSSGTFARLDLHRATQHRGCAAHWKRAFDRFTSGVAFCEAAGK